MTADRETLDVYTEAAEAYANCFASSKDVDQSADMAAFLALIPAGGRILDLGCGPGQWAAAFQAAGYAVEATDATKAMADLARERFGLEVRVEAFEALAAEADYHGIWANFSLLHAPRAEFPGHLARLRKALKPGGALHLGMKLGSGAARDSLGRFYTYYGEDELRRLLAKAGFTVTASRRSNGAGLAGKPETFVTLTAHA
ncbi:SAM-dependent methyltransferase [Pseudooceanicola lipolyticus]|uniref:SAM-dependent methyltransferase n=1 Tax=Pseudooceanicola lipolyticus TaxID=2029104 RepID=A0A2M8IZD7_9RHOB|nr:class I SAM-dependent methyltransferase [Pseudooceanicola lipolyticus]PJE35903.1 SAM-dependent methyltransferase [Pseudooceanicola lipolyticus]